MSVLTTKRLVVGLATACFLLSVVAMTLWRFRPAQDAVVAPPLVVEASVTSDEGGTLAVSTLTEETSSLGDIVEGQGASSSLRRGSVFISTVTQEDGGLQPYLHEWDVEGARTTLSVKIKFTNDDLFTGTPSATRLARGGKYVYVATELEGGDHLQLDAFEMDGKRRGWTWLPGPGTEASLAAAESWVAVVYRPSPRARAELHLFSTPTGRWPDIAKRELETEPLASGQRPSALAFVADRLFVAEQPSPSETRVSELAVPSLKVVKTFSTVHPPGARNGRTQLTGRNENRRLFLLDRDALITLDLDLREEGRTIVATDEVAIGPDAEILTSRGIDSPVTRDALPPPLPAGASCIPAWSGQSPLLACAVAGKGALVLRLRAAPASPWASPQSSRSPVTR